MKYAKVVITKEMEEARESYCGEDADCTLCPCCVGDDCVFNYEEIEE